MKSPVVALDWRRDHVSRLHRSRQAYREGQLTDFARTLFWSGDADGIRPSWQLVASMAIEPFMNSDIGAFGCPMLFEVVEKIRPAAFRVFSKCPIGMENPRSIPAIAAISSSRCSVGQWATPLRVHFQRSSGFGSGRISLVMNALGHVDANSFDARGGDSSLECSWSMLRSKAGV